MVEQHIAIYVRISRDPDDQRIGIARHEAEARRHATTIWPTHPVHVYSDNDLTAADPNVARPGFTALLEAIRRGEVAGVVTTEQSRLTRQPAEWEALCLTLTRAGLSEIHTTKTGPVSVAPEHRLIGRIMAAVDAEEVERIKARTRRAHQALADEGRPNGGHRYGYRSGRGPDDRPTLEVVPGEAAVIRRMAAMARTGMSCRAIAAELDAAQVPTPRGGRRWSRNAVRNILTSPTIAGLRVHNGEIAGPGTWDPILARDDWERLVTVVTGRITVVGRDGQPHTVARHRPAVYRSYLLTGGLAVCGECGHDLTASTQTRHRGPNVPAYQCRDPDGNGTACGRVNITAGPLEAYVVGQALTALSTGKLTELLHPAVDTTLRAQLAAELADATSRVEEAAAMFGAGTITRSEWTAIREPALARADQVRRRLAALDPARPDLPDVDDIPDRWETLTITQRRWILERLITSVTVGRATGPRNRFDAGRVEILWAA